MVELYDKFFRNAFPRMTERLGIVYTPVEVVDFIIHSVDDVLKTEFGQTLGQQGRPHHRPFTGTGTFITRLLQSGLIKPEELAHKYQHEIHANEIVLLAYYIAAINIEAVYHGIVGGEYQPFEGICLTDTFQMYEKDDLSERADGGQQQAAQAAEEARHPGHHGESAVFGWAATARTTTTTTSCTRTWMSAFVDTYAARSDGDSCEEASTTAMSAPSAGPVDRIGNSGVIGFVTNAGFLEANTADGLRKCLADEFSSIYVFHLARQSTHVGRAVTQGRRQSLWRRQSRLRSPFRCWSRIRTLARRGQIHFHDIGDYLSREEKLGEDRRVRQHRRHRQGGDVGRRSHQTLTEIG